MKKQWIKSATALFLALAMVIASMPSNLIQADAADVQSVSLNDSKVLGLSFEGNVLDNSGKGNNGTITGTANYVEGVNGGKALALNGATSLNMGVSTDLQPENLTVSFWVKATETMAGEHIIMWNKAEWNTEGWYLSCLDNNTPLKLSIGTEVYEAYITANRSEFFPIDEWVHIVVTFDAETETTNIYRNGMAQQVSVGYNGSESSTKTHITSTSVNKYISLNGPYGGGKAKLTLDEFEVYSKTATKTEVSQLFEKNGGESDVNAMIQADYDALSINTQNVTANIALPTEGSTGGSTITWSSSNTSVISDTGVVIRPAAGESDVTVKLVATISNSGLTMTKEFYVTVSAYSDLLDLSDFELEQVLITDDYYSNAHQKEVDYLLEFDTDRLLAGFRETAGLDMKGSKRYEGWENSLIGGHTIGHYLTACAQAYASPDTSVEDKQALYDMIKTIVDGLKECQDNTKGKTGFIFGATIANKNNVEQQFDTIEAGSTSNTWVPWYTMHKIIAGLVDVYNITGYEKAKTIASGLGDWTYNRANPWTTDENSTILTRVLKIEYGGMNDCLYDLYKITGNANHATAAHIFDETALFENVLADKTNALNGKHANTTIPKFLGALNRYRALGDEKYLQYAESFWTMVINKHTYITGGNSEWEHFGADNILDAERTNCNCETCNTYNMLKLSRELFKITGEKKYSDYYESTLINAIMSSQNPETGMSMYFQPMATGYFKVYGTKFDKFWCCTGSGMENFTKLNDSVYFYKDNTVFVNQYISSMLTWDDKDFKLTQTTDLLNSETTEFTVNTLNSAVSADVNIRLRLPDWAAGDVTIKVNGNDYAAAISSGYAIISGSFSDGDTIEITIPMEVKAYNLADNKNTYAFKYGPFVLSAELGTENMVESTTGVNVTTPASKKVSNENLTLDHAFTSIAGYMSNINDYLVRIPGTLQFTLSGTNTGLTFSPHYQQHTQRYGIYWNFLVDTAGLESAAVIESKEKARFEDAKLDVVQPGYLQWEAGTAGELVDGGSVSITNDGTARYANAGGYFAYNMVVTETGDNNLLCTFKAEDNGKSMKITIGDTIIYEETLAYDGTEDHYDVLIKIPASVIAENSVIKTVGENSYNLINIKFESANSSEESAKLCNFMYTLRAYSTNGSITALTPDTGKLSLSGNVYTLTVSSSTTSVNVKFDIADQYGYLAIDGNAIDETVDKNIKISGRAVTLNLKAYAEDHETASEYVLKIVKEYEIDKNITYFVDCGDVNTSTVSAGDKFGTNNSLTEQVYGEDPITGYKWGIVDDPEDSQGGSVFSTAIFTANTWSFQDITTDNVAKTVSNRYTKNQWENGIETRFLDYAFELANGKYEVEIGFTDPWNCSTNPSVYANIDKTSKVTLSDKNNVKINPIVKGVVTVTDGELTINARGVDNTLAINMTYIIIKPATTKYSISYQLNGGKNNSSNPTTFTVSDGTISLKNPTRTGYTFAGWYSDKNFKTKVTSIVTGSWGNKTFYAKWDIISYKITYKLNKGTNNKANPSKYTIESNKITLKSPTRKGYTFAGWYSDCKLKKKVTTIAKGSIGNKTLYAKWTRVTVKKAAISKLTSPKSKQMKVTIKKLRKVKGYEISYSLNKKFKSKKLITKTSKTIMNLKSGKTYYVRVRAYKLDSKGKKVYGNYSKVRQITIK